MKLRLCDCFVGKRNLPLPRSLHKSRKDIGNEAVLEMSYEQKVRMELALWRREMLKPPTLFQKTARTVQTKINGVIPDRVHAFVTDSIRRMVETTLSGATYTTKKRDCIGVPLEDMDKSVQDALTWYKKTAALEGAGTGAGGLWLGLADFPLLLGIKMKFLFEAASRYGFDTNQLEERYFILQVFQLAFSSDAHRMRTYQAIENWESTKHEFTKLDWRMFQQEYRDYIDLVKLLQLVPGIGAVVGAIANYRLLDHLGETAMNAYRMRLYS
jgi:hypothetical protein